MELISYSLHPDVAGIIDLYKLELFNIDNYIYDDIHVNHEYLLTLDPRKWKDQDHYSVLRLRKIRYNSSQELIRQAYRKQLLDHHPDKGKQRLRKCDEESNDYFTCITKAFDLLKDQGSRNSYDSVDPEFDNSIPTIRDAKENFYESFGPVFQRNSRWSKIQPVPLLGDDKTNIDEVLCFYSFWDNFQSWREFSYLDEEDKHQGESRDERRYIEKMNRSERKKRSQEESKRINKIIELAKLNDPRIIKYNEKRKADKEADKKAKADKKLELRLAAEKSLREEKERLAMEELERQTKLKDETIILKKQKEIVKNKQKSEKRRLRKLAETYNYFEVVLTKFNNTKSVEMCKAEMINIIDTLCMKMSIDDMTALNDKLENLTEEEMVNSIKFAEEKVMEKSSENVMLKTINNTSSKSDMSGNLNKCGDREWSFELTQFLIKTINSNPPGTVHRWHVIAEYMNLHHPGLNVKEKQVIQRAKFLKSNDSQLKTEAAVHNFMPKIDQNIEDNLKNVTISDREKTNTSRHLWSIEEQRLLEMALKTVPSKDSDRWDKISEYVGTRSKKECMLRFKECAEKLKAKKTVR